jgi:hypothetical protein
MLKGRILKPALAAVITITSAIALSSLGATAASAAATQQLRPSSTSSDPTYHYVEVGFPNAPSIGFGKPPSPPYPFEPTYNVIGFAAVPEGDGFYEWQARDANGDVECITANANTGLVDSAPCGEHPHSQEWDYNDLGGPLTLQNLYTGSCATIFAVPGLSWTQQGDISLIPCDYDAGAYTYDWYTPDT